MISGFPMISKLYPYRGWFIYPSVVGEIPKEPQWPPGKVPCLALLCWAIVAPTFHNSSLARRGPEPKGGCGEAPYGQRWKISG